MAYSGKNGDAKWDDVDFPDVVRITPRETGNMHDYHTSDSGGWRQRLTGPSDWSMTVECNCGPESLPVTGFGDTGTFKGYVDADSYYEGSAVCGDIDVTVDIDTGEPVACTVNILGNGTLTRPTS